jgi:rhodanese-related sulfurtransferase
MFVRNTVVEMVMWGCAAACLGLAANLVHPHRIPYVKSKPPVQVDLPPDVKIEEIEVIQAKDLWDLGEYLFVDSRSAVQYEEGHIAGAVNLPWEEFEKYYRPGGRSAAPGVRPAPPNGNGTEFHSGGAVDLRSKPGLVIYCAGEDCDISHALARRLYQDGFQNIFVFFGGWHAWQDAGFPTEAGR